MKRSIRKQSITTYRAVYLVIALITLLGTMLALPFGLYAGINTYSSVVEPPSILIPVVSAADVNENAVGAEYTATLVIDGNAWNDIYIASNRDASDFLFYLDPISENWTSLEAYKGASGVSSVYTIESSLGEFLSSSAVVLRLKVVSTVAGTSQIVFGIDPDDVYEYANGSTPMSGLTNIINQRRWPAEFVGGDGSYIITFDANEGDIFPTTIKTRTDGTLSSLPIPTRSGYRFVGWFERVNGGNKVSTSTCFTDHTTVYAMWGKEILSYPDFFVEINGFLFRTVAVAPPLLIEPTADTIDILVPFRSISEMLGFIVNFDGTDQTILMESPSHTILMTVGSLTCLINGEEYPLGIPPVILDGRTYINLDAFEGVGCEFIWYTNVEILAITAPDTLRTPKIIFFNANGGSGEMPAQAGSYGWSFTIPTNAFTRDGYSFSGWNTADDGNGTEYAAGATINNIESNITLYAQWTPIYKHVIFNANEGTGTMPNGSVQVGGNYTIPANAFTRSGYTFTGWNTASDGKNGTAYAAGATIANIQSDITLYAQWTLITGGGGGGSSSSGGGGGGGGGPATITGGNGTIPLMYTLNSGVVELFLLDKEIGDIIDTTISKISVFDLSRVPNFAGVKTPKAGLEKLINDGDGLSIQLKTPKGILSFDNDSLKSIIAQSGPYITFSLTEVKYDNLNPKQKAVVNPDSLIVNITLSSGVKAIRDFGGVLNVFVPYEGPLPAKAWYLSDAGALEEMTSSYIETTKTLWFKTNHLSLYVIGKEMVSSGTRIRLTIGSLSYTVGGVAKKLDAAPAIIYERTMVPLRFIAEALGAKVDWDAGSRTAAVALDGKSLSVTIDKIAAGMDVPAMIINDRTMVPLRYVGEALGCDVAWNPDTRTIDISK